MRELRDILAARARWSGEELVLGTVVDVAGSAYRQPGARMLLRRTGERVGLISGGCLEKDLIKNAFSRTDAGPQTVLYDTRGDRFDPGGRYGSGCDGLVHLFLERIGPRHASNLALEAMTDTFERRQSRVLATLFSAPDASSELVGQKIVLDDPEGGVDERLPTALEAELGEVMSDAFSWRRPRTVQFHADGEHISFLVEPLRAPLDLLIFGSGDDVQPVVQMANTLGWEIRIADQWPTRTTSRRFPGAHEVTCAPVDKLLDEIRVDGDTYALVMTHDFEADATLLPGLLARKPAFVGLLGPRRRTMRLIEQLHSREMLPDPAVLNRVQTPLGVDLGGEAPGEVALSVVSGVLAAKNERDGGLIQAGDTPIHDEHKRMIRQLGETP